MYNISNLKVQIHAFVISLLGELMGRTFHVCYFQYQNVMTILVTDEANVYGHIHIFHYHV
jgi:hypothetical protein